MWSEGVSISQMYGHREVGTYGMLFKHVFIDSFQQLVISANTVSTNLELRITCPKLCCILGLAGEPAHHHLDRRPQHALHTLHPLLGHRRILPSLKVLKSTQCYVNYSSIC